MRDLSVVAEIRDQIRSALKRTKSFEIGVVQDNQAVQYQNGAVVQNVGSLSQKMIPGQQVLLVTPGGNNALATSIGPAPFMIGSQDSASI